MSDKYVSGGIPEIQLLKMNMRWLFLSAKTVVVIMLALLTFGCAGGGGFGRAHYFPNKENPEFYLVMEHFPYGTLSSGKVVKARVRVTLFLMPGNKKVLSEIFTVSSVGIIDFEAKMDKRQVFSILMTDRKSPRTWNVEVRKSVGPHGEARYELIPPAAGQ